GSMTLQTLRWWRLDRGSGLLLLGERGGTVLVDWSSGIVRAGSLRGRDLRFDREYSVASPFDIRAASLHPAGTAVAIALDAGRLQVLELDGGKDRVRLVERSDFVLTDVSWSACGRYLDVGVWSKTAASLRDGGLRYRWPESTEVGRRIGGAWRVACHPHE